MNAETDRLLSLCLEVIEEQDDIIHRMSRLLKAYTRELNHLRCVSGLVALDDKLERETREVQDSIERYDKRMGL